MVNSECSPDRLQSQAIKHKNVTYVNISPALHTRPIVEAQGFSRYGNGQFAPTRQRSTLRHLFAQAVPRGGEGPARP
jgi:hypothetical protein